MSQETTNTQEEKLDSSVCTFDGKDHDFDNMEETTYEDFPSVIIENWVCSKCEKVCQHEILFEDKEDDHEYENCEKDTCVKSDSGHEWSKTDHEYCSPDQYEVFDCDHCEGEKTVWYRHLKTQYSSCETGKVFHTWNMPS